MHIENRESLIRDAVLDGIRRGHFDITFRWYGDFYPAVGAMSRVGYQQSILARFGWLGLDTFKKREARRVVSFITSAINRDSGVLDIISPTVVVMLFGPGRMWRFSVAGMPIESEEDSASRFVFSVEYEKERYFQIFLGTKRIPVIPPEWLDRPFTSGDADLHAALEAFRFDMSDGDELWHYRNPGIEGRRSSFEIGFALVREGVPIKQVTKVHGIRG